jgi:hypothetical protein
VAGTRWVQTELLQKNPQAKLVVHAVWFNVMPGDTRESWPADLLTDSRVIHHWDERRVVGRFFGADSELRGRGLIGFGGVMWDTYLLFGRNAEWTERPAPLVGAGYTIIQGSQHLAADLKSALR